MAVVHFAALMTETWSKSWAPTHIVLVALGVYVTIRAYQISSDPLKSVPDAAFGARYTRLWYLWQLWRGDFQNTNIQLHKKYGKIVRTAPNQYSIDDPEAVKVIYGHTTRFTKGDWYLASAAPQTLPTNLFAQQDQKKHAELRRRFNNFYAMSTLVQYESHVNECISRFSEKLKEFSESKEHIDIAHWLQCYAFDVITKITFDRRFGFLENGEDVGGVIQSIDNFNLYATLMGVFPWLHARLSVFGPLVGLKYIIGYVNQALGERRQAKAQGLDLSTVPDFVSKFFVNNEKDPEGFTMLHIFGGAATNVVAGTDTTAISLSSIVRQLATHPDVLTKLRAEIQDAKAAGKISDPITFQESQGLTYFQAVIKESLRVHPAAGLPMWRVVPEGGVIIAGRHFPSGTEVGINAWVAHRNEDVFGSNPELFRPERWLVDREQAAAMEHYFLSFGAGSRTCIGRHISMLEISKLVPQLFQQFNVLPASTWADIKELNRWFVKPKGLQAVVELRE
ncbi:hypothetical protein LTR84_000196 [Exophiala bonariae]|uniref:Cytochrome P450 oxidoreductase n=1 Tax=Exophiala bonariae TaxID=1690606 RepID=A0AAV9NQA2_9EURO|nr:hypothetical protein LTR84_000196 [Exophiala bonariae]